MSSAERGDDSANSRDSGNENAASDSEVLAAAGRGGPEGFAAFEVLVARYRDRIYRLALSMTKSESEAEEVVQDAFLSVFRNLGSFRGASTPSTWIYRVATNSALMRLRTRRRKPLLSIEDLQPARPARRSIWPSGSFARQPETAALDRELRSQISAAIAKLPDKYRIVLLLRDVEGLSNAEVAKTIGVTIPTVKARLHRSRLYVRNQLEGYFQGK